MSEETDGFTGVRKAAIFLASIGADASAQVFRCLEEDEIEMLSGELSRLPNVDEEITGEIQREFLEMALTKQYITSGGMTYALEVLEKALGKARANEIVGRIQASVRPARFSAVRWADPHHLASILRREHPQTIALILSHIEAEGAASILAALPEDIRSEVVIRMATLDKTSPEVIKQVEQVLEKQVSAGFESGVLHGDGAKTVAAVLNSVDPVTQREILERLEEHSSTLAEQIRNLMFTFEDLVEVDDRGLQRLIQDVDQKDLVLALKAASDVVSRRLFANMSERTASIVKQELDFLGPVRLKLVQEAQRRVVAAARALRDTGEIVIGESGGDSIVR